MHSTFSLSGYLIVHTHTHIHILLGIRLTGVGLFGMDISSSVDEQQSTCNIELGQTLMTTNDLLLLAGVDALPSECVGKKTFNV